MSVYNRKGVWYVDYYYEGQRVRESTRCTNKRAAERYLAARLTDIERGQFNLDKVQKKLRIFLKDFVNNEFLPWIKQNRSEEYYIRNQVSLAKLIPFFKGKLLSEISPLLIEKFKMQRLSEVMPATVRNDLACLKRVFSLACRWGKAQRNPVREVDFPRTDNKIERVLTEDEESKLLDACGVVYNPYLGKVIPDPRCAHIKPIVITALDTGMRLAEVLNLKWSQIDFAQRIILVQSYKVYPMPISERLYFLLQDLKKTSSSEYVFCDRVTKKPLGSVKTAFKTACDRAGIKELRFHDLRHTFASRLRAKGVDLVTIKELLGHADIRTTMRYAHTNLESKKSAIGVLHSHKSVTIANSTVLESQQTEPPNPVLSVNSTTARP